MSTSQIKQIGGRAGRYGLLGDSSDGGVVTTLYPEDLHVVEAAMNSDLPPIPGAVLPTNFDAYQTVQEATLVVKPQFTNVLDTISLFSRTRHPYIHGKGNNHREVPEFLNATFDHLTMEDTMNWFLAPVSWRDETAKAVATRFLRDHRTRLRVNLVGVLRQEKLLQVLETACSAMAAQARLPNPRATLVDLETIHKSIILYMWMGQRMPVVFADLKVALELKEKAEKAMEFVLQGMTKGVRTKSVNSNLPDRRP